MKPQVETISGKVNVAMLEKADRLFRNDDDGVWIELLQNAWRANATAVDISVEESSPASGSCLVTVHDDGQGIESFQSLLTLGSSGWDSETQRAEDPAGMGFFSLCRAEVEVHSGTRLVKIPPSVFLGKGEARVERVPFVRGTRIRFARTSTKVALVGALERVTEFYPLAIRLDGRELPRHDFLEGALYREQIDGIEVGFATAFEWKWNYYGDGNWNFYGSRIREPFRQFTGIVDSENNRSPLTVYARFNVLETARVKLQLPDRRAITRTSSSGSLCARRTPKLTASSKPRKGTLCRSRIGRTQRSLASNCLKPCASSPPGTQALRTKTPSLWLRIQSNGFCWTLRECYW